jgi:1-acyl-sn-glycerol-3-phosphate acyltransferase
MKRVVQKNVSNASGSKADGGGPCSRTVIGTKKVVVSAKNALFPLSGPWLRFLLKGLRSLRRLVRRYKLRRLRFSRGWSLVVNHQSLVLDPDGFGT